MKHLLSILLLCLALPASARFTLVIDAGHGGHDAGAIGSYSKEKDINLRVALAFGGYVERNCRDVNVRYTRKTDVFVPLHNRADIANKAKADLFISVHTNALPNGKISRGLETYTLGMHRAADNLDVAKRENGVILIEKDYRERYQGFDPNSAESYIIFEFMQDNNMQRSVDLAKLVQRNVCTAASRPDKGVKQAGFLVLRETSMPSCLIELGFISTPDEEALLNNAAAVDNIARGIYLAFAAYLNKYTGTPAAPSVIAPPTPPAAPAPPAADEPRPMPPPLADKAATTAPATNATQDKVVFKVQILAVPNLLPQSDSRLKGRTDTEAYKEGSMVKYTLGATTNYTEALRLQRELRQTFPDCFLVAFRGSNKLNIQYAISEAKKQ